MSAVEQMAAPFVLPNFSDLVLTAKFFRALGSPIRLRILKTIVGDEKNVSELVEIMRSPQGRVSSHLACLRWCGFVSTRKEGRSVYYRVADPRVRRLIETATDLMRDNADRIRTCTLIDTRPGGGRARRKRARRP